MSLLLCCLVMSPVLTIIYTLFIPLHLYVVCCTVVISYLSHNTFSYFMGSENTTLFSQKKPIGLSEKYICKIFFKT